MTLSCDQILLRKLLFSIFKTLTELVEEESMTEIIFVVLYSSEENWHNMFHCVGQCGEIRIARALICLSIHCVSL